jgi:uncharacterized caspase-like protein
VRRCPPSFLPVLLSAFLLLAPCGLALAGGRTALVIGNAAYPTAPLRNPVNDATDMAAALAGLGFEVTLLKNASMQQMEEAVRAFGLKLRGGGMGLFYFAGHGVQVAGENYLVPVNAVIQSEGDVKYGCLNAGLVLAKMEDAGNGPNIVILDACRNNPFARSFRSAEAGLARMDAPTGSIIAYATAPGKVAGDGEGRNGLYTQHLLRSIATPGLSIGDLFMNVREGVVRESGKKQVPWENTSLIGRFSFAGQPAAPAPAPAPKPAPKPAAVEQTAPPASPDEAKLMADLSAYRGTKRDEETEAKLLARAQALAARGSVYGRFAQGWLSLDEIEHNQAVAQAVKQNIPLALVSRAEFLAEQPVTPADEAEARELLQRAMRLGEPEARLDLGNLLIMGKGGAKDVAGGERLFAELVNERIAYGTKVALAYFALGEKHLPKTDADAKGIAFARRAASQGDVAAMMLLVEVYQRGGHGPKNPREAWSWLEKAAGRGDVWAMMDMASAYQFGSKDLGVQQNEVQAYAWYRKAAGLGNQLAAVYLAKMVINGQGVVKNVQEGLAMLKGQADQGSVEAQYELGTMYLDGDGVPANRPEAYYWYSLAQRNGSRTATFRLVPLAPQVPAAERAKLDAKVAAWKPKAAK